ncbi:MAG: class I adenylate-forming enzyme family protein [Acidimicrobiales bacterium]
MSINLASLLLEHPFSDDQELLHLLERSVTAGAARARVRAVASELAAAGLGPGDAVAVQLPNEPETVAAMAGVWAAGCVVVPVNLRAPAPEVARIVALTGPAAILDEHGLRLLDSAQTYEPASAFVLWTSGTTGAPKAIVHTHDGYLEILDRVLGPLRGTASSAPAAQRRPSPNLIPVPLTLNSGIYNTLFGLRAGAAIVLMERFETAAFATLVRRFEIRSTVLPPAAITMLNDDARITDLIPLRYVRSITAPLSPRQARRFTEKFTTFILNGYGQAEIGEVIGWTAADAKEHPEKIGAVGRAHAGVDLKLVDERGDLVEPGQPGLLRVRPPTRAAGYAGGESLQDRVDAEGFVDTGDVATIDEDGFVWIEGRAGEVINRGGNKLYPGDIEEVLRLDPAVKEAAVVGVPDERLGEVPVAFVTGDAVSSERLDALCRQHLAPYKVPVAFHHVDALPMNEAGKVLRRELAGRVASP